jgi:single-strand DNA-binding protein
MIILNKIILIGRLVRDPQLRYTSNGIAVCNFTLAVERNYSSKDGENDVDFIKIVTWRKTAESCAHHLGKGRLVAVEGSLQIKNNKSEKDGRTYINPEVVANNVKFLDWPDDNDSSESESNTNRSNQEGNNTSSENNQDFGQADDEFDVPF